MTLTPISVFYDHISLVGVPIVGSSGDAWFYRFFVKKKKTMAQTEECKIGRERIDNSFKLQYANRLYSYDSSPEILI